MQAHARRVVVRRNLDERVTVRPAHFPAPPPAAGVVLGAESRTGAGGVRGCARRLAAAAVFAKGIERAAVLQLFLQLVRCWLIGGLRLSRWNPFPGNCSEGY